MLKKTFKTMCGAVLAAFFSASAMATNIPPINGPLDPANQLGNLNQAIQNIDNNVTGVLAALPATTGTSGTTATTFLSFLAPGGTLSSPGQLIHIKGWGSNSADTNTKTVTFTYGSISCTDDVSGSSQAWVLDFYVLKTGAATQNYSCYGVSGTTPIALLRSSGTVNDANPTTISMSGTAATSGALYVAGAYVEQIK